MRKLPLWLLLVPCLFAATPLPEPRFSDPQRRAKLEKAFPEIEKFFEDYRRERAIPGLVYGLIIDGEVALLRTSGVRDRKSNDPVTPGTVFRIASMTKSFTALAILKLRDEGKLSLDDPVSKWIPEVARLKYPTSDTAPLRVRQLVTHGTGLPEDNPWGDRQLDVSEERLTAWLKSGLPFSTPPDTAYEYSNYGFALAGRVVSRASGKSYREYVEKEILAPLGMRDSTLEPSAVPAKQIAIGYGRRDGEYFVVPPLAHGSFGAMGGLLTSAGDLARYVAYHLSAWPPRDGAETGPVRRSSVREMQRMWRESGLSVQRYFAGDTLRAVSSGYGYGLRINRDCRFDHVVSHGGGLPGFGSYMMWLPEYGVGMFAMANLTYAGPMIPMDRSLDALRRTGGLQPRRLPPSPALVSTRDAIVRLWERWDEGEAQKLAADNLFPDLPSAARRKEVERLKADLGACRAEDAIEPENLLRGAFRMNCERGFVKVSFTLAPTQPPRVQYLDFSSARRLEPAAKSAAEAVASLIGSFSKDQLAALAAPKTDQQALARDLENLRAQYGACRLGETLAGDGRANARVRFECERAPLDASLRWDEEGRLRGASFSKPSTERCVP